MSVVALTGCSGYIGSRLLRFMEASPDVDRIVGIDLREPGSPVGKLEFHRLDIRDPSLANLFVLSEVDRVVHLAFIVNPLRNDARMHDIDVNGGRNVLAATAACHARHLILASSSSPAT